MIRIVDYGLGKVASGLGVVKRFGREPIISADPEILASAEKLVLPEISAFGDGMRNLRERGLVEALERLVFQEKSQSLASCLGV